MNIYFLKMQASGNDYVYCDLEENDGMFLKENASYIAKKLSKRRFSIGSDGLVLIEKSKIADAKILIFNADGSEAKTCGNALRCVGYYLSKKYSSNKISIETNAGIYDTKTQNGKTKVNFGKPIKKTVDVSKLYDNFAMDFLNSATFYNFVDIGNEHLVVYLAEEKFADNGLIGRYLCGLTGKCKGVNVEFVSIIKNKIYVTVYERGSGKTYSCGSGAVAVYYALTLNGVIPKRLTALNFMGGKVFTEYVKNDIYLSGKVETCFRGTVHYDIN